MSWQCRLIEYDPNVKKEIGDMWYADKRYTDHLHLSQHYHRDWSDKRLPLYVMTPGGGWCVDGQPVVGGQYQESGGWTVTGEVPNITVSPSINFPGYYHGWLQNGILSDDLDGKTY
jgi:hypothetical protein